MDPRARRHRRPVPAPPSPIRRRRDRAGGSTDELAVLGTSAPGGVRGTDRLLILREQVDVGQRRSGGNGEWSVSGADHDEEELIATEHGHAVEAADRQLHHGRRHHPPPHDRPPPRPQRAGELELGLDARHRVLRPLVACHGEQAEQRGLQVLDRCDRPGEVEAAGPGGAIEPQRDAVGIDGVDRRLPDGTVGDERGHERQAVTVVGLEVLDDVSDLRRELRPEAADGGVDHPFHPVPTLTGAVRGRRRRSRPRRPHTKPHGPRRPRGPPVRARDRTAGRGRARA